jgi:DNA-binding CsgD family transcriptional regulator/PAS domain-containing protein
VSTAEATASTLYERAAALVEALFDQPADPTCWQRALAALCGEIGEGAVAVVIGQLAAAGPVFLLGHGLPMRRLGPELLAPAADQPPSDRSRPGSLLEIPANSAAFGATPLYREVLRPAGLAPGPGLCVSLGRSETRVTGAVLVLSRDPRWRPRPEDRALLELLTPYLMRAVRVGLDLNERRSGIEALLGIFDALVLGVMLLDRNSEVSFLNQAAARLLGVRAGLRLPGPAGRADRARRNEAAQALLRSEAGAAGRPFHVISTPLRATLVDRAPDAHFATAVFFGDPSLGAAGAEDALRALYGLTPSEERLALRLASGEKLAEAAATLHIRPSTARSLLRSVFGKTDTHRQSDLVRLVLTLVGQVRIDSPRG